MFQVFAILVMVDASIQLHVCKYIDVDRMAPAGEIEVFNIYDNHYATNRGVPCISIILHMWYCCNY